MAKDFLEGFAIKKGDIISLVGAGGKTSLMYYLAQKLRDRYRVLLTTSTKIGQPEEGKVDRIYRSFEAYEKPLEDKIVLCLGQGLEGKRKLGSLDPKDFEKVYSDFDISLIEADGCRNLPMKMWKDHEPVIFPQTTKTIGIFNIQTYGLDINEAWIYNYQAFEALVGKGTMDEEAYYKLITHPKAMFKDSAGEKIVFLNQVESEEDLANAKRLVAYIRERSPGLKLLYGSIFREQIYEA